MRYSHHATPPCKVIDPLMVVFFSIVVKLEFLICKLVCICLTTTIDNKEKQLSMSGPDITATLS